MDKCAALERQMQQLNEHHASDLNNQQHAFNAKRVFVLLLSNDRPNHK